MRSTGKKKERVPETSTCYTHSKQRATTVTYCCIPTWETKDQLSADSVKGACVFVLFAFSSLSWFDKRPNDGGDRYLHLRRG